MTEKCVGRKRRHLHTIVGRIGAETIVKSKRRDCDGEQPERKFINSLLLHNPKDEIQKIEPKDPTKKTKIYVLHKPAGLTNGAYLSCSACGRHAFKLYRIVKRKLAPEHLQKFGLTENDILRICKRCWYQGSKHEMHSKELATRPFFQNQSPLGITNRRACSSWHFLRRDFVRKRVVKFSDDVENSRNNIDEMTGHEQLASIVTLIANEGNSFICQPNGMSLFSKHGTWLGVGEARYYGHSQSAAIEPNVMDFDRQRFENLVCDYWHPGIDIESDAALLDHDYTALFCEVEVKSEDPVVKDVERNSIRTKKTADKLLKHSIKKAKAKTAKTPLKSLKTSQPLSKENKMIKGKTLSRDALTNSTHRQSNITPKFCALCRVPILKSYGSYKRDNAPEKLKALFTSDVICLRACRRCVPYQKPPGPLRVHKNIKLKKVASKPKLGTKKSPESAKIQKTTTGDKNSSRIVKSQVKSKTQGNVRHVLKETVAAANNHLNNRITKGTPKVSKQAQNSVVKTKKSGTSNEVTKSTSLAAAEDKEDKPKGNVPDPKLCVVCSLPVGKSYRRCTYSEIPLKYRYTFQLYKGQTTLRVCRKCLARKSWADYTPKEGDSSN